MNVKDTNVHIVKRMELKQNIITTKCKVIILFPGLRAEELLIAICRRFARNAIMTKAINRKDSNSSIV